MQMLGKECCRFLQGPEAGACLECLGSGKRPFGLDGGRGQEKVVGDDVREEIGLISWGRRGVLGAIVRTLNFFKKLYCDHLEGWDREGGRETQEGGDMGIYVYV